MASKKIKKFKLPKNHLAQMRALQQNPKRKDQIMSFKHIYQYHDAVLFVASEKGVILLGTYHFEMKKVLDNYKKEVA